MEAVLEKGNTYLETIPMSNFHGIAHRTDVPKVEEES